MKANEIKNAFAQAATEIPVVSVKGRGHAERASVGHGGQISKAAADGAELHFDWICGSKYGAPRRVFPVSLINRAAEILNVPVFSLIGRRY